MEKIKCPVCGAEIYRDGQYLTETDDECIIFDDDGNPYVSDAGEIVTGRQIKNKQDLARYAIAHSIHPCSFWEQHKAEIPAIVDVELGWYRDEKSNGLFYTEIYADYRDVLEEKTAIEVLSDQYPLEKLERQIWEWYDDEACRLQSELVEKIISEIPELEAVEDLVRDWLYDHTWVKYPTDHFLKQDVYINIEVDTGDGNYDFVLNKVYPAYNEDPDTRINSKAAILWLAKQQGYTKTQLWKAMIDKEFGDSKFLSSLREEVLNVSTHMNVLTFLWKTSLEEAIALADLVRYKESVEDPYDASKSPYCGYIVLDKDTPCGLYDSWNGGGSLFEICLEKDVRLPARFINRALPDGGHGYSIGGCYGVNGRFWEGGGVKEIHFPKKAENAAS